MKIKNIIALTLATVSIVASSCSKNNDPEPQKKAAQVFLSLEAEQVAVVEGEEDKKSSRGIGYDLANDEFKLPKINFGTPGAGNITVMAFFRNVKTQKMVHVKFVFNTIQGSNKLYRTFSSVSKLEGIVDATNWNHWYVKMFIGGYPEKVSSNQWPNHEKALEEDPDVNQVRFVFDGLWDVTSNTTHINIDDTYLNVDQKWGKYPLRPLPMETEWTKVAFTNVGGATNPQYSAVMNKVLFKPMGSLLRVAFHNQDILPVSVSGISLYDAAHLPENAPDKAMLVNHMLIKFNNLQESSAGVVNEEASITREGVTDGFVHYHFPKTGNTATIHDINQNEKRVFMLWVHTNPSKPALVNQTIRPTVYLQGSSDHQVAPGSRYFRAPEMVIPRTKYQPGKAYRIRMNWKSAGPNDFDFNVDGWVEGDDQEVNPE